MQFLEFTKKYDLLLLRLGLAFVFLYFGFSQINNPSMFVGFLPSFVSGTAIDPLKIILLNGWFEIVCAFLLVLGAYTRITALLLAIHLFGIAFSIGFSPTGVRDFGLAVATLYLSSAGAGSFSVDNLELRNSS